MTSAELRYLNNAGTSWPKAPGVAECVARTLTADPSSHGSLFAEARAGIAASIGAADPTRLLLTPGCTSALSSVLWSVVWRPGDVIVTSAVEHHAVVGPVQALVRQAGVVHRRIDYRRGDPFDLDVYRRALAREPVRLVVVTAASNVTGELLPVAAIGSEARAANVPFVLDAAQVAGLLPLDVEASGADAVAFAGHKGPLAPQGIGGLWLRPGVQLDVGYCDVGSVNLPAAVALDHSLRWLTSDDAPPPGHAIGLRAELRTRLLERPGCRVFGGDGPSTGTVSIALDALPLDRAEAHFAEHGVLVRAGMHCAAEALGMLGAARGTIRVSFGQLNVEDDVDAVLRALDRLGPG